MRYCNETTGAKRRSVPDEAQSRDCEKVAQQEVLCALDEDNRRKQQTKTFPMHAMMKR
jgi:hypothetical protein